MARQGTQTTSSRSDKHDRCTRQKNDERKKLEKKMNREKNVRCQREKLHVCRFGAWTLSNPQSGLYSGVLRIHFPLISQIRFDVVFYQIYTLYTGVETTKKKKKRSKCRCMWRSGFFRHAIFSDNFFSFADTLLWQVKTKIDWVKTNCQRSVSEKAC